MNPFFADRKRFRFRREKCMCTFALLHVFNVLQVHIEIAARTLKFQHVNYTHSKENRILSTEKNFELNRFSGSREKIIGIH